MLTHLKDADEQQTIGDHPDEAENERRDAGVS